MLYGPLYDITIFMEVKGMKNFTNNIRTQLMFLT